MDTINQPGWSSIRPWIPPLSLTVREITSVSVTFILSAATSDFNLDSELSLAALGLSTDDLHEPEDEFDTNDDEDASNSESDVKKMPSVVSSALTGGLSVEVDRALWRKVFIKIDDKADEAVIIVYGLLPGRQYDIDLELVQGGQTNTLRHQVTTEETEKKDASPASDPDSSISLISSSYTDVTNASTIATSASPSTPPQTNSSPSPGPNSNSTAHQSQSPSPGYGFAPLTLEDRLTQLQHTLSVLNNEQMTLTTTIKTSRRDAQKADAALRSEIETLKRASERYAASELRAKQKVLALQEAVKQAQIATKEIHATVEELEEELPALNKEKEQKEKEYQEAKTRARKMTEEKEKEEEKERKRIEEMRNELAGLGKQIDKLEVRKEKLDMGIVNELENELRRVEDEIEKLEDEETFGTYEDIGNGGSFTGSTCDEPFSASGTGASGRPTVQPVAAFPIQRSNTSTTFTNSNNQPWISTVVNTSPRSGNNNNHHSHGHNHLHTHNNHGHAHNNNHNGSHNQRLSSVSMNFNPNNHHHPHHHNHPHSHHPRHHQQTAPTPTTILTNPNRQSSLKSTTSTSSGGSAGGSNKVVAPQMQQIQNTNESGSPTSGSPSPKNVAAFATQTTGVPMTAATGTVTGGMGGTGTPVSGSMLSSRAPPFEPGRGILRRSGSSSRSKSRGT